jgi:hypothetical protein
MGQADEDVGQTQINYNKQVTIGSFFMDDTEITNNEYRQFIEALILDSVGSGTTITGMTVSGSGTWPVDSLLAYYPDTTVFVKDFSHHMGDPLQEYYYAHPAFVIGEQNILMTTMLGKQVGRCLTLGFRLRQSGNMLLVVEEIWLNTLGAILI